MAELKYNGKSVETKSDKAEDTEVEEVVPEVEKIFEIKTYTNGMGKTVIGQHALDDPDNPVFIGACAIPTPMGNMRLDLEFDKGMNLIECFEQFEVYVNKAIEKAQKEAEDQGRIVVPNGMSNQGQIITP